MTTPTYDTAGLRMWARRSGFNVQEIEMAKNEVLVIEKQLAEAKNRLETLQFNAMIEAATVLCAKRRFFRRCLN